MKQPEVIIGATVLTKIGDVLAEVIVERETVYGGRMRFVVRRVGETRPLPKPRTAAALRKV